MFTRSTIFKNVCFLLYPEHLGFVSEGERQLKNPDIGRVLTALFFAIGVAVFVGLLMMIPISEKNTLEELAIHGITTTGTIIDHRTSSGKSTTYYVTYEFSFKPPDQPRRSYKREQSVAYSVYELENNASVDVSFLPTDPSVSRLSGTRPDNFMIAVLCVMIALGFIWPLSVLRDYGRKKRFEQEGQVIMGKLQSCTSGQRNAMYLVTSQYVFQSPEGKQIVGKQIDICAHLKNQKLPQPGIHVAVLYLNNRRYQML